MQEKNTWCNNGIATAQFEPVLYYIKDFTRRQYCIKVIDNASQRFA